MGNAVYYAYSSLGNFDLKRKVKELDDLRNLPASLFDDDKFYEGNI